MLTTEFSWLRLVRFYSCIINKLMLSGVTFIDPDTCYIDAAVIIGNDTIIYPNCIIEGNTNCI